MSRGMHGGESVRDLVAKSLGAVAPNRAARDNRAQLALANLVSCRHHCRNHCAPAVTLNSIAIRKTGFKAKFDRAASFTAANCKYVVTCAAGPQSTYTTRARRNQVRGRAKQLCFRYKFRSGTRRQAGPAGACLLAVIIKRTARERRLAAGQFHLVTIVFRPSCTSKQANGRRLSS